MRSRQEVPSQAEKRQEQEAGVRGDVSGDVHILQMQRLSSGTNPTRGEWNNGKREEGQGTKSEAAEEG